MKVVLIGSGNLATNLGKALLASGHDIMQVYSRTMAHAETLAHTLGATAVGDIASVAYDADVYIISVKDSVLADIIPNLCRGREKKLFLHTAGSMPMDVFSGMAQHYGVLYPMQTFSKDKDVAFSEIPCFVEANDATTLEAIRELASSVSKHVVRLSSEDRKYLHLSAVFACNFVNHCYAIAADMLERHGIPFDVMYPLIDETARKVHTMRPSDAQTGPAVRFDENVIRAQAMLLKSNPLLKDLYERMSISIHSLAKNKEND